MLTCQKKEFQIEDGVHFLNCAYLGPIARRVEEAGVRGLIRKRSPIDFPASAFYDDCERLRRRFASLVEGEAKRVAILPSVSYGIATAARNLAISSSQNVVILGEQFPSNVYIWRRLAREIGYELRTVARPHRAPCGLEWNARVLEAIDTETALVAIAPSHWTDGTRFDLASIGVRAREVGAALILDASQSLGAVPLDVGVVRPDALICAGYKWLLGPYSMALGYFGARFDDGVPLEETWIARRGSEDFQALVDYVEEYRPGAVRYDMGERSNFIQVPMMIEALDLILAWRPGDIHHYLTTLLDDLAEEARTWGWAVEDQAWRAGHVLGLGLPGRRDLESLDRRMREARIHASLRGRALRVSPHVYNDRGDVEALREVLLAFYGERGVS